MKLKQAIVYRTTANGKLKTFYVSKDKKGSLMMVADIDMALKLEETDAINMANGIKNDPRIIKNHSELPSDFNMDIAFTEVYDWT